MRSNKLYNLFIVLIVLLFTVLNSVGCTSEEQKLTDVDTKEVINEDTASESQKFTQPIVNSQANQNENQDTVVTENLKIHFIDVGQADSILITTESYSMLIDSGNNDDSNLVVNYIKAQGISKLDYIIGTHPHEDHIGGLDVKNKGLKVTSPKVGDTYGLSQAQWTILAPNKDSYEEANNSSIVIRLVFGNNSFMFTGDAKELSESEILAKSTQQNLNSDVLKEGHHGSNSSTTD